MLAVCINTVSPFTACQRRLVTRIWVERSGDTTIKTLDIASCESCPSRRRHCYIIPGMVLRQCATSQDTGENSTPYVRSSHRMHLIIALYDTAVVQRTSIYIGPSHLHTSTCILVDFTAAGSLVLTLPTDDTLVVICKGNQNNNKARPRERSDRGCFLPLGKKAFS